MTLADDATSWMDRWFDPDTGLLWNPEGSFGDLAPARSLHLVPQSCWYAVGLAARGDAERCGAVVDALLALQYHAPGTVWDGTFARFLEWPTPPTTGAVEWEDYDPNWRQFLGTALTMLVRRFPEVVGDERIARIGAAVRRAVTGEPPERIHPSYTNIALKVAWLDVEWGDRDRGERLAGAIHRRARRNEAFEEFNSPTYDGISLWGIALWRSESSSPALREWGAELEALLWRRIGERYHAGLRNCAGPYSRAYGMDMERTYSLLGLWIDLATDGTVTPLPDPDGPVDHSHDRCFAPLPPLVGTVVPDDVRRRLVDLGDERSVRTVIEARDVRRECTAWLADGVAIGAEHGTVDWGGWEQHVAGTVHWRSPEGPIAWLRLRHPGPPRAVAEPGIVRVAGEAHWELGGALGPGVLGPGAHDLPGCRLRWSADGEGSVLEVDPD